MRFEPAGMTDDPDLRIAASLVDYIFRRLAVDYLPYEERAELGILTTGERMQPTLPGVEEVATPSSSIVEDPGSPTLPASEPSAPACARPAAAQIRRPMRRTATSAACRCSGRAAATPARPAARRAAAREGRQSPVAPPAFLTGGRVGVGRLAPGGAWYSCLAGGATAR